MTSERREIHPAFAEALAELTLLLDTIYVTAAAAALVPDDRVQDVATEIAWRVVGALGLTERADAAFPLVRAAVTDVLLTGRQRLPLVARTSAAPQPVARPVQPA